MAKTIMGIPILTTPSRIFLINSTIVFDLIGLSIVVSAKDKIGKTNIKAIKTKLSKFFFM